VDQLLVVELRIEVEGDGEASGVQQRARDHAIPGGVTGHVVEQEAFRVGTLRVQLGEDADLQVPLRAVHVLQLADRSDAIQPLPQVAVRPGRCALFDDSLHR